MGLRDVDDLLPLVDARQHAVGEVGAVEVADEHERVAQGQLLGDVAAHALGGRGRISVERCVGELLAQRAQLPVLRTKIVAPMADAMRLVDGEGLRAGAPQQLPKSGKGQPLRGDEQHLQLSSEKRAFHRA